MGSALSEGRAFKAGFVGVGRLFLGVTGVLLTKPVSFVGLLLGIGGARSGEATARAGDAARLAGPCGCLNPDLEACLGKELRGIASGTMDAFTGDCEGVEGDFGGASAETDSARGRVIVDGARSLDKDFLG